MNVDNIFIRCIDDLTYSTFRDQSFILTSFSSTMSSNANEDDDIVSDDSDDSWRRPAPVTASSAAASSSSKTRPALSAPASSRSVSQWSDEYTPVELADVSVHPKKVSKNARATTTFASFVSHSRTSGKTPLRPFAFASFPDTHTYTHTHTYISIRALIWFLTYCRLKKFKSGLRHGLEFSLATYRHTSMSVAFCFLRVHRVVARPPHCERLLALATRV